mgnify:CR=1 FL=1
MDFYDILQVISCSMLFALWLTIFYKRDFEFTLHLRGQVRSFFGLIFAWGLAYLYGPNIRMLTVVIAFGTLVYVWRKSQDLSLEEKVKCVVLGVSLVLVNFLQAEYLACGAVLCALSQLLRWPVRLKSTLREFRIVFGPVYTVFIVGSSVQSDPTSTLLRFAMSMALVASIPLRPDNNEVLTVLNNFGLSIPNPQSKKMAHGFFMFTSFVLCLIHIVDLFQTGALDSRVFCTIVIIASINACMYIFVADLPRRLLRIN